MNIKQNLVALSKYPIKAPYSMVPTHITIHNTYNDAPAANEIAYMIRNENKVSFHIAVDDVEAIQGIPFDRSAWHCGDGNGDGNRKSIGVEICYSKSGGDRYYKAEANAAVIVAQLIKQFNIPISNVVQHANWSKKDCPHRMRAEGRWEGFVSSVKNVDGPPVTQPTPPPTSPGVPQPGGRTGVVTIVCNELNMRKGPSTDYQVVGVLKKGKSFIAYGQVNGWYNLGGEQWVSGGSSYVSYQADAPPAPSKPSRIGVATTKVNLNVRKGPGTNYGVVRTIPKNESWNVYEKQGGWLKVHDGWISGSSEHVSYRTV